MGAYEQAPSGAHVIEASGPIYGMAEGRYEAGRWIAEPTIYLSIEHGDPATVLHELRHLQQFVRDEPRSEVVAERFARDLTTRRDKAAWVR